MAIEIKKNSGGPFGAANSAHLSIFLSKWAGLALLSSW